MMKTSCIIVDDEPLARAVLTSLLSKFEDLEVIAECSDTFDAFKVLQNRMVDLMFLDIQMPEVSGLEFLRSLRQPPAVILTTAHRQYALEGFDLDVVDYLLKPISYERLMKAINKYYHLKGPASPLMQQTVSTEEEFITIRADRKNILVRLSDILYISSLKDYVQIYTEEGKYITQIPVGELEKQLPAYKFLRIHRSYIINISKVTAFTSLDVEIGKIELPIGRNYKNRVNKTLNQ